MFTYLDSLSGFFLNSVYVLKRKEKKEKKKNRKKEKKSLMTTNVLLKCDLSKLILCIRSFW